jgi:hypothetical protein
MVELVDRNLYRIVYITGLVFIIVGFTQFLFDWENVFENDGWNMETISDIFTLWNLHYCNNDGILCAFAHLPFAYTAIALGMATCFGGAIQIDREDHAPNLEVRPSRRFGVP